MQIVVFSNKPVYASEKGLSSQDELEIKEAIFQVSSAEGKKLNEFVYTKKEIYHANEVWAGYVIDFTTKYDIGYAIVFKLDNQFKIIELFFDRHSPYYEETGMPIYFSLGYYFIKKNGRIFDVNQKRTIRHLDPDNCFNNETLFYGSNSKQKDKDGTDETLVTPYERGYKYSYEIPNFYSSYSTGLTMHKNNCANAAGLILVNYWNTVFKNDLLKLNSNQLTSVGNIDHEYAKEIMAVLYDYMNTNWIFGTGGTLPGDGYNGFEKLIKEKKYTVSRNRNLSFQEIKTKIRSGTPVMLTSTDYYFTNRTNKNELPDVNASNGTHSLSIDYDHTWGISNAHTVIGYGFSHYSLYKKVEKRVWKPIWYNPFRRVTITEIENFSEELIKIANGWGGSNYFSFTHSSMYDNAAFNVSKVNK